MQIVGFPMGRLIYFLIIPTNLLILGNCLDLSNANFNGGKFTFKVGTCKAIFNIRNATISKRAVKKTITVDQCHFFFLVFGTVMFLQILIVLFP